MIILASLAGILWAVSFRKRGKAMYKDDEPIYIPEEGEEDIEGGDADE